MTNSEWVELIQLIPPERHNTLMLVTTSGVNLGIEVVLRTEPSYLVFRGRVCGNTDEGRAFFLPYTHIDYVNINRNVKEEEIREIYKKYDESQAEAVAVTEANGDGAAEAAGVHAPTNELAPPARPSKPNLAPSRIPAAPAAAGPPATGNNTPVPSVPRNSILERLRAP